jgi:hypothetical protein
MGHPILCVLLPHVCSGSSAFSAFHRAMFMVVLLQQRANSHNQHSQQFVCGKHLRWQNVDAQYMMDLQKLNHYRYLLNDIT